MRKDWSQILVCKLNADGYTENRSVASGRSEIGMRDYEFEKRLENWGRCLNPSVSGAGAASTFWAKRFYEIRNSERRREFLLRGLIEQKTVMQQIEDQAWSELMYEDALLVESAWVRLGDAQQKKAIQMRYIDRHKDEYIRRQLRLRGRQNLTLILWRAKTSMKQILESTKKADIIRVDNLNSFAG